MMSDKMDSAMNFKPMEKPLRDATIRRSMTWPRPRNRKSTFEKDAGAELPEG